MVECRPSPDVLLLFRHYTTAVVHMRRFWTWPPRKTCFIRMTWDVTWYSSTINRSQYHNGAATPAVGKGVSSFGPPPPFFVRSIVRVTWSHFLPDPTFSPATTLKDKARDEVSNPWAANEEPPPPPPSKVFFFCPPPPPRCTTPPGAGDDQRCGEQRQCGLVGADHRVPHRRGPRAGVGGTAAGKLRRHGRRGLHVKPT